MKVLLLTLFVGVALGRCAEAGWKTIDEGFCFVVPQDWVKEAVRGVDSHVGKYRGKTVVLSFDDAFGLSLTSNKTRDEVNALRRKKAASLLRRPNEEIWELDGRLASFTTGKADAGKYGEGGFAYVATLDVPYDKFPGYLSIRVRYESEKDLPVVRKILGSIQWNKDHPSNQVIR